MGRWEEGDIGFRTLLGPTESARIRHGHPKLTLDIQAIGAAPDAIRMQRVVNFYEKLPRGPAPEVQAKGFFGKYQAKHFGKNPSAKRTST